MGKGAGDLAKSMRRLADPTGALPSSVAAKLSDPASILGIQEAAAEEVASKDIAAKEKKQKAIEAKQQALIDKEQKALDLAADERKTRLAKRDLLFGSETGITGNQKGSLLS